jgi:hypothetical protein
MIWLAAGWIVATVEDLQTVWDFPYVDLIRGSVGAGCDSFSANAVRINVAVAGLIPGASELPAA